jgi:two-component system CheB/CheR fusion protein
MGSADNDPLKAELQDKALALEGLNDDLDNLLSNTHIAVVFLDTELKVRRFTPAIDDLLGLVAADIACGFDEYLPKPVDPQRLLSLIAQLAPKRAQTRES